MLSRVTKLLLRSEVDKPSKILIKALSAKEYIKSDIQNTCMYEKIYLQGFPKGILKAIQVSSL